VILNFFGKGKYLWPQTSNKCALARMSIDINELFHPMQTKFKVLLDASNVHDASCICTFSPSTFFSKRESHGFGDIRAFKEWT